MQNSGQIPYSDNGRFCPYEVKVRKKRQDGLLNSRICQHAKKWPDS